MQKISTRIFIAASLIFGVVGILVVITAKVNTGPNIFLVRLLFAMAFIILPSFALSVAGKYLKP